ncbi:MAG: type II toxin-antitoxin system VapC family toxin [Deltaproteobacteria bacterium]|nr:type II toxin-antitoxin system VapC family toxin [Deltaproteobacteria bacterium]
MRLLLDTHVVLWALSEPDVIAEEARDAILDPVHEVLVSAVSAWELAIKQSLGKIRLPRPAETWLPREVGRAGFAWLAVSHHDALRTRALPWHHRDPFDRLLVAQALGGCTLVSRDRRMAAYGVPLLVA